MMLNNRFLFLLILFPVCSCQKGGSCFVSNSCQGKYGDRCILEYVNEKTFIVDENTPPNIMYM